MKCPKCAYPKAKFVDKKYEEVKEEREHRSRTGASYTTTVTKRRTVYKRGVCPKCQHTWEA